MPDTSDTLTKKEDLFREPLLLHLRDGTPLTDALGDLRDSFYGWKRRHPDEFARLVSSVTEEAEESKKELVAASSVRQVAATVELRDRAAQALLKSMPDLEMIATKTFYDVVMPDGVIRRVVVYPRDKITNAKVLQELAQFGTLPEPSRTSADRAEAPRQALPPLSSSPPINFANVSLPPGTKVTVDTPDIVDAEVEVIEGGE